MPKSAEKLVGSLRMMSSRSALFGASLTLIALVACGSDTEQGASASSGPEASHSASIGAGGSGGRGVGGGGIGGTGLGGAGGAAGGAGGSDACPPDAPAASP